jgi:hypothetical protein
MIPKCSDNEMNVQWYLNVPTQADVQASLMIPKCSDNEINVQWYLNVPTQADVQASLMSSIRSDTEILMFKGRAIAQAVSRWLPTAAARVQTRV